MFGTILLTAAAIGQMAADGPVLSEATKQAHARALAESRANEHTIQPRLEAHYRLENKRLKERTAGAFGLHYIAPRARNGTARPNGLTLKGAHHDRAR